MVLPMVPLVLIGVGAVTGVSGAVLGVKGAYDIKKANRILRRSGDFYEREREKLETHEATTNAVLVDLGAQQDRAIRTVVERMADFLRRHEKQVSESEKILVDGLEPMTGQVNAGDRIDRDVIAWMRGILGTAVTGVGINTGITTAVTTFATASTGTAISTLSGAAATNATLAAIGGGSLASGGGGMAAGAMALNFVTIGPALLVSGFMVAGQGEKAMTKACANQAAVSVAIAEMETTKARFALVVMRAEELATLLEELVVRATLALDNLESEEFDPERHAAPFQEALVTTVAVRDVASVQVVDESGDLNEETASLKLKYRTWTKETNL